MAPRRETHIGEGEVTFIPEMGGGIQPVDGRRIKKKDLDLEAFMNEKLLIIVHESDREGDLPTVTPQVNGISKPIVRGQPTLVARKYVEVLARNKKERFKQYDLKNIEALPPMVPTKQLQGTRAWNDSFTILEDKNPKGAEWIDRIKHEAA